MTVSVKVTVVIPVYNRGKYVGEAIKSFVSNNGRASAVKALHRARRATIRRQVTAQRTCTAAVRRILRTWDASQAAVNEDREFFL
jgi:hypothetical protein